MDGLASGPLPVYRVHRLKASVGSVSLARTRLGIRWKRPRHEFAFLAASQRGLKKGLKGRFRTVILMRDKTILVETSPLASCYGRIGEQVRVVPITVSHARRVLRGALNVGSGEVVLLISDTWDQQSHQAFLRLIRSHWRGWRLILFEDRGKPHMARLSRQLTAELNIPIRLLPRATPELNAMDHLWRFVKGHILDNQPALTIDQSTDAACQYLLQMDSQERLRKACVISGNFLLIP